MALILRAPLSKIGLFKIWHSPAYCFDEVFYLSE
jgi:hypothetical protein